MPLLRQAKNVILVGVAEDGDAELEALHHLASQLAWHGVRAETRLLVDKSTTAPVQLQRAAVEVHADLLVVGGYGHKPLREVVFGGVTRALIERAEFPVFMIH